MIDVEVYTRIGAFQLDAKFQLPANGVTAIFGPSGCGKTSLLRAIAGLQKIDKGTIRFKNRIWQDEAIRLPVHERSVGFVFQQPSLFAHLTVQENLEYGLKRAVGEKSSIGFAEVVELLKLEPLLARSIFKLSGGEAQRVSIGRALLANPKLLLMDEPLASLDESRKREIFPYLERLSGQFEIPVLYVSHAMDEVVRLADRIILMEGGKVLAYGPIMDILIDREGLRAMTDEPFSLIQGRVVQACSEHHLTEVQADDLLIRMPGAAVEKGQEVRLRLYAKDISLTLDHQKDSSILNIFATEVQSIENSSHPSQKLIHLQTGRIQLLARVSTLSCEMLDLRPGKKVFAQIKAASLIQ